MLEDVTRENGEESVGNGEEESFEVNDSNEYFYPKSCYTCKARFLQRHHFYDRVSTTLGTHLTKQMIAMSSLCRTKLE